MDQFDRNIAVIGVLYSILTSERLKFNTFNIVVMLKIETLSLMIVIVGKMKLLAGLFRTVLT